MRWLSRSHGWPNRVKTRLEARLAVLAAAGQTITYGALARELDLRIGVLTAALEALMAEDAATGGPLRAALCAARAGDGLPARGFFDCALGLGYEIGDPAAFVAEHRAALRLNNR
jgi:hypothetical protein